MEQSRAADGRLWSGFREKDLPSREVSRLRAIAAQARGDILLMTSGAGSGHPGGSLSSIDIFLLLWTCANVSPKAVDDPGRDRIVVSHGHTAAAVYAALGRCGYYAPDEAVSAFRSAGSPFEGHAYPEVPGVEWECGCLGQGLSAACGMAVASALTGIPYRVYCVMGDGEQQKGQIAEARRFAVKYGLHNLTAVVDCNGLQAMGSVRDTMPQDLEAEWEQAGWHVATADGHDFRDLHHAFASANRCVEKPSVILARTVMGKGVSFMENRYEYHGKVLSDDECRAALREMGLTHRQPVAMTSTVHRSENKDHVERRVRRGTPRTYETDTACREAFGKALADLSEENPGVPMAVFDCDLARSVGTDLFAEARPGGFFQCGIQEHSTSTIAGAAAKSGVLSFFAGLGVFGLDETYNQQRLNDINDASLKLILTHCGLDVGQDGRTHQCIDYIGLASNLFGTKLIVPADANQTDRAIRYVASTPGRFAVALGRSKAPIVRDEAGEAVYGGSEDFAYGRADWVRRGDDATIVTLGSMVWRAVAVSEMLAAQGRNVGVLNVPCPLELDTDAIGAAAATGLIVTYEDHHVRTGIGSLFGAWIAESGCRCRFRRLGVERYGTSGSAADNYRLQGLDPESVARGIASLLENAAH